METFSALLAICAGKTPAFGEFPAQRPVMRSFNVFFDLRWINGWVNNRQAGELRRHRANYDVTVMLTNILRYMYTFRVLMWHIGPISLTNLTNHNEAKHNHVYAWCYGLLYNLVSLRPGVGVAKSLSSVPLFFEFSSIIKTRISYKYHICSWHVSLQLSCSWDCQI